MGRPKATFHVDERARDAESKAARRAEARDIDIPKVKDPKRRARGAKSLIAFKATYFPHLAYLRSAEFQLERLRMLQHMIRYGGKQAKAEPRGSAKTTDAGISALWALLYGYKKHFMVIRASDPEAIELINDVKRELESNDLLFEDFPEVCACVRALEGAPQRAGQQTANGERTRLVYKSDTIVLPSIKGSVSAGSVLTTAGITGKIRGRKVNGRRPDFCLMDDIEDEESVESEATTKKYEKTVNRSIGGLGGPGVSVATLWLGTIMKRGCLIDRYTDRTENPIWQGKRQSALVKWPSSAAMKLWGEYEEIYREGKRSGEDPDGRRACRFYAEHRAEMDEGAEVAWPENYIRDMMQDGTQMELSALQNLMNHRMALGEEAFLTEYQNDPPDAAGDSGLTWEIVASRLSLYPHGVVPNDFDFSLVQGIDIRGREIHYSVSALKKDGTSARIDYDIISVNAPTGDLRNPNSAQRPALERAVLDALRQRRAEMEVSPYRDAAGEAVQVALTLVDSGWLRDVVYQFCKESGPRWRATKGNQKLPGKDKYTAPARGASGIKFGNHWHAKQQQEGTWLYHLDADFYKLRTQESYMQTPDTPGSSVIFGNEAKQHKLYAKHVVSERWDPAKNAFVVSDRYNHFLDCEAACHAAADMVGASLLGNNKVMSRPRPLSSFFGDKKRAFAR